MFNKKKRPAPVIPLIPTDYPTGVCVVVNGNFYYINGKFRHPIIGNRILESWKFPYTVPSSEEALTGYHRGARLGFRDGSLVRDLNSGNIYIISQRLKRSVLSPDVLAILGLTTQDFVLVSNEELKLHKDGEVLK